MERSDEELTHPQTDRQTDSNSQHNSTEYGNSKHVAHECQCVPLDDRGPQLDLLQVPGSEHTTPTREPVSEHPNGTQANTNPTTTPRSLSGMHLNTRKQRHVLDKLSVLLHFMVGNVEAEDQGGDTDGGKHNDVH